MKNKPCINYGKCHCGVWHGYFDNFCGVNEAEALRQELITDLVRFIDTRSDSWHEVMDKIDRLAELAGAKAFNKMSTIFGKSVR